MSQQFQDAFEEAAPNLIAVSWDFTGRSMDIDMLWVYFIVEDNVRTIRTMYRIDGEYFRPGKVHEKLPEVDTSLGTQIAMLHALNDEMNDFVEAAGKDGFPVSTVMKFRPEDQDFSAEFSYEPLEPGVPESEQMSKAAIADRWEARLFEIGNDSPDF